MASPRCQLSWLERADPPLKPLDILTRYLQTQMMLTQEAERKDTKKNIYTVKPLKRLKEKTEKKPYTVKALKTSQQCRLFTLFLSTQAAFAYRINVPLLKQAHVILFTSSKSNIHHGCTTFLYYNTLHWKCFVFFL